MQYISFSILADLAVEDIARLRLAGMLAVLVVGLVSGYLSGARFALPEHWARKIMTAVLVCFNWPIALLVIWRMQLSRQLVWLPLIGVCLMLAITAFSTALFSFLKLDRKSRLTLILAGALSNQGYTGGAFVCYALFGIAGLGLANLYIILWLPVAYLIFLPLLKVHELRTEQAAAKSSLSQILDPRCLAVPAVITAIALNLANVKMPDLIARLHIIDIFVYIASGLSFFAIGLGVKLSHLKNYVNLYLLLAGIKFVLTPAVAVLLIALLVLTGRDLSSLARNVIIILSVTPSAVFMVTASNVFGLDSRLASALWVVTMAVFVAIVVPVLFFIFA